MKMVKILIASLILVTQSYGFSKSERNFLLGLSAGAVIAYAIDSQNVTRVHHSKRVYVNSAKYTRKNHHDHYRNRKYHRHHDKHHRRHHGRDGRKGHRYEVVTYNKHNLHHSRY